VVDEPLMLLLPLSGCALFVIGMKYAELPNKRMAERVLRNWGEPQPNEAETVAGLAREVVGGQKTLEQIRVEQPRLADPVERLSKRAFERFSGEMVFGLFASFILPIIAIAYATTSLEEIARTARCYSCSCVRFPAPRSCWPRRRPPSPWCWGPPWGATICTGRLAGPLGARAFPVYLPVVVYTSLAYTGLFHLFAVCFRHSTIVALIYALFIETFLGNMPGIVKQVAVNYYGRSMMIELGGLKPPETWFVPVSAHTGVLALASIAGGSLLAGVLLFPVARVSGPDVAWQAFEK